MEDYYYSNDEKNEGSNEGDYYYTKPYSRAQFIKANPHIDERIRSMRLCGVFIVVCILIDVIRIYRTNNEYDIESFFKLACIIFVGLLIIETVIQIWAIPICCIVQILLSSFLLYKSFKIGMFIIPPGNVLLVAFAIHIEQTLYLDEKWNNYKRNNS